MSSDMESATAPPQSPPTATIAAATATPEPETPSADRPRRLPHAFMAAASPATALGALAITVPRDVGNEPSPSVAHVDTPRPPRPSGRGHRQSTPPAPPPTPARQLDAPTGTTSSGDAVIDELILQLHRLCQRQRYRSDERTFVRDVERILSQWKQRGLPATTRSKRRHAPSHLPSERPPPVQQPPQQTTGDPSVERRQHQHQQHQRHQQEQQQQQQQPPPPSTRHEGQLAAATDALNLELLWTTMAELFGHRYPEVRALAFDVTDLCLVHYGPGLSPGLRQRIFAQLEAHAPGDGDFARRQKTLRLLTQDGRHAEPFGPALGWLLLQWIEDSDEQRDLLGLIQGVFRRGPRALVLESAVALTSVVCGRCDVAWAHGDLDACRRYLAFFHVVAAHHWARALGTSVGLRTLCCLVNADGHGTWAVMKELLSGDAAFQVLRGLVLVLENHQQHSHWVLRGAVFFVGMSCWGSQRVARLDEVKWAPVLLALEQCLGCEHGVVIFEIILALQRLVKKYGDARTTPPAPASTTSATSASGAMAATTTTTTGPRRIVVEWDIILRMFRTLRPWLSALQSPTSASTSEESATTTMTTATVTPTPRPPADVPVHQTRIPHELLDTLLIVEELVRARAFAGEVDEFYDVLGLYRPHLPEASLRGLLRHRAARAHPAHHLEWLQTLDETMTVFFADQGLPDGVRLEALELLQLNLWSSRHVCEDRVIEEVLIPTLTEVYDDPSPGIRRRGLDLVTEVARQLESVRFDALLEILETALVTSIHADAREQAICAVVSLFSSAFDHLPHGRALRMYEVITATIESHRDANVRRLALECLLRVCEASTAFRLQWRDAQVRTSRFLYCSSRGIRQHQQTTTAACMPVALGLRALLTLISTETQSLLFRMAVEGLRRMLKNRIILADVDVSDLAVKIMSCVDYRAFGRAAIPDEVSNLLDELEQPEVPEAPTGERSSARGAPNRPRRVTETDISRILMATTATSPHSAIGTTTSSSSRRLADRTLMKASIQEVATQLCKARFTTMGLELLELFISYLHELNAPAKNQLMMCLIGTLDHQLIVTDRDVTAVTTVAAPAPNSEEEARGRTRSHGKVSTTASSVEAQQTSSQSSGSGQGYVEAKPVSPHVAFTSRVLSRLQGSGHQGLFHPFSGSTMPRSSTSESVVALGHVDDERAMQQQRHRRCLRLLYDAEFSLLHTACNALSLVALVIPDALAPRIELFWGSVRRCFQTSDGGLRADAYGAVLEMVSNILSSRRIRLTGRHCQSVLVLVLEGFRSPIPRATAYVAYRVLCEMIFQSSPRDRLVLAMSALPVLKECSLLPHGGSVCESAIDFLMCYALARSSIPPPALRETTGPRCDTPASVGVKTRTWVHHRTILTIEMPSCGPAQLIVRRPNATSRWHLAMHQDVAPAATNENISIYTVDSTKAVADREVPANREIKPPHTPSPGRDRPPTQRQVHSATLASRDESQRQQTKRTVTPKTFLWQSRAAAVAAQSSSGIPLPTKHFTLPVPPLPAYDGIGGSPSYFCESATTGDDEPEQIDLNDTDSEQLAVSGSALNANTEDRRCEDTNPAVEDVVDLDRGESPQTVLENISESSPNDPCEGAFDQERAMAPAEHSRRSEGWSVDSVDPLFLMMQLFDLNAEDRPVLLSNGPSLQIGLNVLDRTPEFETHKVGVLYVRNPKQKREADILNNLGGSLAYLRFLRSLGAITRLRGLRGYSGGMDTVNDTDGKYSVLYRSSCTQIMFHVASMMTPDADETRTPAAAATYKAVPAGLAMSSVKKKRHIGNDFVHIIFNECDEDYNVQTFTGQFNDVHIIVQPLNDREYRTQVHTKPGIAPFGPLYGTQIIPSAVIADCVRLTCLNANLACQAYHQDCTGFTMNYEERLKQIQQLETRNAATSDNQWCSDSL